MSTPGPGQHLGEVAGALVDGELGHAARDRALAHLAGCAACRALVDEQRQTKALLAGLGAPAVPPGLAARLSALREPALRLPATAGPFHVAAGPAGPGPQRGAPARGPRAARRPGRLRRATGAGAVLTGLLVGSALVVGGGEPAGTPVDPSGGVYLVDHAETSGGLPLGDAGAGAAVSASFTR